MKILRLYSDAARTYAQIIYNGQKYDVIFDNGNLRFNPILETVGSRIKSAPPEAGTEAVSTLLNLLEAMDYVVHEDIEAASIPPVTKIERTPHYATEWTLENNWDPRK